MPHLDRILEGGLARGELGVIIAPPNRGKTMSLVNLGFGASGFVSATDTLHVSLEMRATAISKRYGARITHHFIKRNGIETPEAYARLLRKNAKLMLRGRIMVKEFPSGQLTVSHLEQYYRSLVARGIKPGCVIVDYADLMKPSRTYTENRHELASIYRDLRAFASIHQVALWTATQSNRDSLHKEVLDLGDIAESFEKAAIADVCVALSQTRAEYENQEARLYMAKVRDSRARGLLKCVFKSEGMYLATTGETVDTSPQERMNDKR